MVVLNKEIKIQFYDRRAGQSRHYPSDMFVSMTDRLVNQPRTMLYDHSLLSLVMATQLCLMGNNVIDRHDGHKIEFLILYQYNDYYKHIRRQR